MRWREFIICRSSVQARIDKLFPKIYVKEKKQMFLEDSASFLLTNNCEEFVVIYLEIAETDRKK